MSSTIKCMTAISTAACRSRPLKVGRAWTGQDSRPHAILTTAQPELPQRCGRLPAILSHRIASHLDTMGVVNEPVEDAVSHGWIANLFMPTGHR
jgi:hypothetical protein